MKTFAFLVAASFLITLNSFARKETIDKRFSIGPGGTYAISSANSKIGGNLHFDFFVTKKLNAGVKYIFCPDNTPGTQTNDLTTKHSGHDFNVSANASYYLIGDNQKSKFGFYPTIGVGYWNHTLSTTTIPLSNKGKEDRYSTRGLMSSIALGMDTKMGIGRLYIDATSILNIKGSESTRIIDTASPKMNSETTTPLSIKLVNTFFINLGYSIIF